MRIKFYHLIFIICVAMSLSSCQEFTALISKPISNGVSTGMNNTPEPNSDRERIDPVVEEDAQIPESSTATNFAGSESVISKSPTPNPYFTPTPTSTAAIPEGFNSLTGKYVDSPENLMRMPVMVKISNYPREMRPQSGWSRADIIFEYYIGQGMNRFLGIFWGDDADRVGPIRSGRLVDIQLAEMYQGLFVYGGADDRINSLILDNQLLGTRAFDTRYYDVCPPICGTDTHSDEGVFVDTAALTRYAKDLGIEKLGRPNSVRGLYFSEALPSGRAMDAESVEIEFSRLSRSRWIYDPENGDYFRLEEVDDDSDQMTNSADALFEDLKIRTDNVVVLFADYVVYDPVLHDIQLWANHDGEPAIFFRNGYKLDGEWSSEGENQPISLWNESGEPYLLKPGKSWYIIMSEESEVLQMNHGVWNVEFAVP